MYYVIFLVYDNRNRPDTNH